GGDKEARHDVFATQVSAWQTQERVGSAPIGLGSSFEVKGHPVGEHLRELAALRKQWPVLWRGATLPRDRNDGAMAISRFDMADQREYVTIFNNSTESRLLEFATSTPSATFTAVWGDVASTNSDADGFVSVEVPPLSAAILRAEAKFPLVKQPPVVFAAPDDFSELWLLSAETSESPQEVSFLIDDGTGWRRVAVDDSYPYRAFVDPDALPAGSTSRIVAVSRFADGTLMRSDIAEFTNTK
ncbi:MAG: hypothetical protein EBT73_05395, partial [Actinobacteria bacterium]|nr:hypothetical protein [Actinomycetota bacterium]